MNSVSYSLSDTITMSRRVLTHMLRNPGATILGGIANPIVMLVLIYNLFGGMVQLGETTSYINYLAPGLIVITAIYSTGMATMRANTDMTQGIIARFKTMSIARSSVLNGHVIGSVIGTLFSISVITGLVFLTGFRPTTSTLEWFAALGVIVLFVVGVIWLAVAIGVASMSPEAAQNALFLLYILPFFSSAFTPTSSMTPVVAWIAENQPFSPIIDTVRGLLIGTPIGNRWVFALAWCLALSLIGFLWARISYNRNSNS